MKPWVWLFLVVALCGCGQERPSPKPQGFRPPDKTLPLLEPDSTRTATIEKQVELVFEEHHWAAGSTTPVISQLALRCSLDDDFQVQGAWGVRHFMFTGTIWSDKNPEQVVLKIAWSTIQLRGQEQNQFSGHTTRPLKPEVRGQFGGTFIADMGDISRRLLPMDPIPNNAATDRDRTAFLVWFRPYAQPVKPPIPAIFRTP